MDYELDLATVSTSLTAGVRSIELTDRWNTPAGTANGGYLAAILVRAALAESNMPDPLSASITYLKPTTPGEATLTVTPVRVGRRVATYIVVLTQAEQPITHATISLHDASAAEPKNHLDEPPPPIPAPADGVDPVTMVTDELAAFIPEIAHRYTTRHADLPGWMSGHLSGQTVANFWIRPVDERPIDAVAAGAIVDAYPPVTLELGEFASSTVQLTVHFWRRFTSDWVQMEVVTRRVVDGFHDEDVRLWDSAGNLVATSRQIALLA